ncbi:MAG TPA: PKD domain-containing protein [Cellulomonas sp.]
MRRTRAATALPTALDLPAVVLVVALAAIAFVTAPTPATASATTAPTAPATASAQLTPPSGLLFGAFVAKQDSTTDVETSVSAFEQQIGRKLDLVRFYVRWDTPLMPDAVVRSVARDRTPVLSITPKKEDGTKLSWASIAAGDQDARIREQAAAVAGLGVPVFLVFQHEPDMATGYGSPAEFRAAWRHYVEVFRQQGVTNAAWTWVMTPTGFAATASTPAGDFYPGDDVVDWIALDPYNWYGCAPSVPTAWQSMAQAAGPFRTWAQPHGKPLMLAEWGSVEDPADPARRADWYRETLAMSTSWPELKAISAFDATGNCAWRVDSTPTALQGFVDAGDTAAAHGRASALLTPSTTVGAVPLTVAFDASRSTGSASRTATGVTSWSLDLGDGTSQSGQGQPPAAIAHTYATGTFTARLVVTDATGDTASDTRTVTAAPPPAVTGSERDVTTTSMGLYAWVNPVGLTGTARFEWGTTTAYGSTSASYDLAATTSAQQLSHTASGLTPGTRYYWRITATTAAGTTVLARSAGTVGAPSLSWSNVTGLTATGAVLSAGVDPHRLATTTWVEWGPTSALGQSTATTAVAAGTSAVTVRFTLSGLAAQTTYRYRWVASNSQGTTYGPTVSFTTTAG